MAMESAIQRYPFDLEGELQGAIVVILTTAVLGFFGVFLRDQLEAGRWWVLGLVFLITAVWVYWISPEDRPTYHRFFNWLLRRL